MAITVTQAGEVAVSLTGFLILHRWRRDFFTPSGEGVVDVAHADGAVDIDAWSAVI